MNANPVLLQKKYARIIDLYAAKYGESLEKSMDIFYTSKTYELMSHGVADLHCMSDDYIVEELHDENMKSQ